MTREQVQRIVLTIVGLLFLAAAIPGVMFFSSEPSIPMLMSLYVTLGIFLLLAARNPSAHRLLIAYGGWPILYALLPKTPNRGCPTFRGVSKEPALSESRRVGTTTVCA